MNKLNAALTGLIAFGVLAAWAVGQTPNNPPGKVVPASATAPNSPAMPGTRVAVLNINSVLKNFQKAQYQNNSIKQLVQSYADRMNKIKEEVAKRQTEMPKPTTTQQMRETMEKEVLSLNRQLQDMDTEARKVVTAKQAEIAIAIFKEIEVVVDAVAKQNNFDLVLSYPDATTKDEMYVVDNVVRKMASQAAIPLYHKPHIDLTNAVIATLNASFPAPTTPAAPPATPAPTPPPQ